jgi:hypothetical protein
LLLLTITYFYSSGEVHWVESTQGSWLLETIDGTVITNSQLAKDLLGWEPKIIGLLDHLEFYYASFKAYEALNKK